MVHIVNFLHVSTSVGPESPVSQGMKFETDRYHLGASMLKFYAADKKMDSELHCSKHSPAIIFP